MNEKLARRYATAVFSLAQEGGAVDRVGDDLAAIAAALDGNSSARDFFLAPVVDRAAKERVLLTALGTRIHTIALHTVLLLVRKRREAALGGLLAEYRKLQLASRGEEALTVTTARELSRGDLRIMVGRLEQLYRKKFDVTQIVDPKLIGGVRILMGDRRIDGTVEGRLEALARNLFATN